MPEALEWIIRISIIGVNKISTARLENHSTYTKYAPNKTS